MYKVEKIDAGFMVGILQLPDFAGLSGLTAKREIEKRGTLFLLEKLFNKSIQLSYSPEGKPYLANENTHISISHSHDKLAIIRNDKAHTGIDVELIRDKVLKIKDKFLSSEELLDTGDDVEKLVLYWAAKESLYKLYGLKEVEFAKHLRIDNFTPEANGNFFGNICLANFNKKYLMHYEKLEDYMLVYVLNEVE